MRVCRFENQGRPELGFFLDDQRILPLSAAINLTNSPMLQAVEVIDCLPGGGFRNQILQLQHALANVDNARLMAATLPIAKTRLLVPIPAPGKLLLLAGNYSAHIEEGGGKAEERAKTFPYVFMKPPATTLISHGEPIRIPRISPDQIDWEIELAVVIGRTCRDVKEQDALDFVAGYSVINDISDRNFKPNPGRTERPNDKFFDWLHGKWHDTFCPMGPCVAPADEIPDPQTLKLQLRVNGNIEQNATTAGMIFPVAAVVAFISSIMTLHPGDVIATGTPDGVGKAKGKFLKPGDIVEAEIEGIGLLRNPVV